MLIAVRREPRPERRVPLTPRGVKTLVDAGHDVTVAPGAGDGAAMPDDDFVAAGARIAEPGAVDLLLGVGPLTVDDTAGASAVLGFLDPLGAPQQVRRFADAGTTALALEMVPRTTQAQSMDALSSQATALGYAGALLAATELPRFFPMMMTAAGTIAPARVLVLGAGVAGLQALATARRLGAVVAAYDIRPAAREQVESLGAAFVGGPVADEAQMEGGYAREVSEETRALQQQALAEAVAAADAVITTAAVPGRRAPVLVTSEMVDTMKPGALVIDLAAPTGGNCAITAPGETIERNGVRVMGPLHLVSTVAGDASDMLGRNVTSLVTHLWESGSLDTSTEIGAAVCVARDGEITSDAVRTALEEGAA
jgi:NAD(P) transhydrogenase subunit alpha